MRIDALHDEYEGLGRALKRRGADIDRHQGQGEGFAVAVPSWGVGTGGTRFAHFPIPGEPTNIFEKLEDCAVIQALGRNTPTVSPHFPWDKVSDVKALKEKADGLGLKFDAVNSNTFQDQAGPAALVQVRLAHAHADAGVRDQAVAHNIECIEIGKDLGSEGDHGVDRRRHEFPRASPT